MQKDADNKVPAEVKMEEILVDGKVESTEAKLLAGKIEQYAKAGK